MLDLLIGLPQTGLAGWESVAATVGIDDEVAPYGSVTFGVVADGRTLTTTPVLTGTSAATPLDVDVSGVQELHLVVQDGGDGNAHDHADWADARLTCGS